MCLRDGYVYQGEFVNGKKSGQGEETLITGDKYAGEFVDGLRQG
jgi:hypothetical protein